MDSGALKILTLAGEPDATTLQTALVEAFPQAQVFAARSSAEVTELAAANDLDVILLDSVIPGTDVLEVCRKLKTDVRLQSIPIIVTTVKMDRASRIRALEEGVEAFLRRPFDEVELAALVRAMAKIKAGNERQRQEMHRVAALVTEHTAALEKELAAEAERQVTEAALNAQTDTFFVFQPSTGRAVRWNRAFNVVSGYSDREIRSMKAPDSYYSPEDLKKAAASTERVLQGGTGTVELELITKSGRRIPTEYTASVISDAQGIPQYIIALGRDITERTCAEESLRESEERFRRIFEEGPIGIATSGADFRFLRANAAFCRLMGRTESELRALTFRDLTDPEDLSRDIEPTQRLLRGEIPVYRTEKRYRRPGNEAVWGSATITVVRDREGRFQCFIVMIEDITERKQTEVALRRSEAKFRAVIENSYDGIIFCDANATVLYRSSSYARINGYTDEDRMGRNGFETVHPDDLAAVRRSWMELAQHPGMTLTAEFRTRHKDGKYRWVESTAQNLLDNPDVRAIICVSRDITERRKVEDALRESEARFRTLIEDAPVAMGIGRDLTHLYVNRAYLKMFGLEDLDEVIGRPITDNWSPEWPALLDERARQRTRGVSVPPTFEAVARRKDGTQFPAHAAMTRVELPDGPAVLAFITDISERQAAERERLDYQRRLRSLASELSLTEERERRRIATGLHDHACQTLVLSKMKLQRLQMSLPSEVSNSITDICGTLDETIESVREMTFDLSSPALYRFGLEAALKELLKDKLKTEHGIHGTFRDDGLPKPLAEDVRILLFQSVRELLVNVVKHARAHEVTLDIGRLDHSIRIVVADDGVGFDMANVLMVSSGRQGFGLFNIRERVDFIGGTLKIDSRPGHGSRFTLMAPLETDNHMDKRARDGYQDRVG